MANGGTDWWDPGQEQLLKQRKTVQFTRIRDALGPDVHIFPGDDPAETRYLYKDRTILARKTDAPAILAELGLGNADKQDDAPVSGVTTITVPAGSPWANHEVAFNHLDARFGRGFAMPDAVVHVTTTGGCPATEPDPWSGVNPIPAVSADANAGKNKTVLVPTREWTSRW